MTTLSKDSITHTPEQIHNLLVDSVEEGICGDPDCGHIHLRLFNEDEKLIALMSFNEGMLTQLLHKVRQVPDIKRGHGSLEVH